MTIQWGIKMGKGDYVRKIVAWELVCLVGVVLLSFLYHLWFLSGAVLFVAASLVQPRVRRSIRQAKEDEYEYNQLTIYMEQLLCSYKRNGSLVESMTDCLSVFEKGEPIGKHIEKALYILQTGEGVEDGEIVANAFATIEKHYNSKRLRMLHEFLNQAEQMGGKREQAIDILLEDLQLWKRRTTLYQKKKKYIRVDTVIAVVFACCMCILSRLLVPKELGFDIADTMLYQVVTTAVLCGLLSIVHFVWKKLTGSWLDGQLLQNQETIQRVKRNYKLLCNEQRNPIKKHLAYKICRRQVETEYPYWLLSITLLLQTESVYCAMEQSVNRKCGMFADEVRSLLDKLYDAPNQLYPYTEFFQQLEISEVQTGMKILYSVNQNGYEESKRQLDFLISQNNVLMDRAENNRYENQTAGLSLLKHLPMLIACVKMVADLVNLLALTMGTLGQMA